MEGRLKEDLFYVEFGDSNIDEITLCYINEDNKSELYVYTDMEYALYTDYDGRVIELLRGHGVGGDVKWWERGNRILQLWYEGRGTIYSDDIRVYEIANGELHQIGKGNLVSSLTLAKTKGHPLAAWNDIEVTEDKYYVFRKQAFDEESIDEDKYSLNFEYSDGWDIAVKDRLIDELYSTIEELKGNL